MKSKERLNEEGTGSEGGRRCGSWMNANGEGGRKDKKWRRRKGKKKR